MTPVGIEIYAVDGKIIRALEIFHIKKLTPKADLWKKIFLKS